jgi:hypothetical protein
MFTGNAWMMMTETGLFRKKKTLEKILSLESCSTHPTKVYNQTEWEDDILTVLNEQTINETLDNETHELLKRF